jgi:alcohol dehydrogenase
LVVRQVTFRGPGQVAVKDRPEPIVQEPGDAIVKVSMSAICGSELPAYRGEIERPPGDIGHEFVGTISAVGETVERLSVGERVVSPFSVFCGGCFYCKQGLLTVCENFQAFGRHLPGTQAEYVRVPNAEAVLQPLPDGLPDEKAIFVADLLTGVYAGLDLAGVKPGYAVAVAGCGPTGLTAQLVAHAMGAGQVFGIDHHEYRLAAAERIGSIPINFDKEDAQARVREATGGRGADIAVEAAGSAKALSDAAGLARGWGTLLNLGTGLGDDVAFPVRQVTGDHVRLVPAGSPAVRNYMAPVLKMLANGVIDPAPVVSHTLSLDEAGRGFEMMSKRSDGALKVLLRV